MAESNLLKNTTIYALGDIIPRLLSFISFPILTSYLSPAEFGIINYINTINIFLLIVSLLGLNTYYLVYYYRTEDETSKQQLLGNLFVFVCMVNLFLTLLLFLAGPFLMRKAGSNIDFYPYMAIGLGINFFNVLGVLPSALYRLQERPAMLTILNVVKGFLIFAFTLLMVVVFKYKAVGVLWSNLVVSIFFGIIFMIITLRNMKWYINWPQIKHALLFSLPLLPGSVSYYLITMSDRVFIDRYLTLSDLGIYSTAATLALLLNIVAYGAYKAFEPYIFRIYNSKDFAGSFIQLRDGFIFVLLICVLSLSLFSKEFFEVFASEPYLIAYRYVPLILIGVFSSAVTLLFSTVITARGKTKVNSLITIAGGLVSVTLNITFLRYWGILAACMTSGITLSLILFLSVFYSRLRLSHIRPFLSVVLVAVSIAWMVYLFDDPRFWSFVMYKTLVMVVVIFSLMKILQIDLIHRFHLIKKNRV